jgi:hypothetical protein
MDKIEYKNKFKHLQYKCGVYSLYNKDFELIYIGKSYNLYERILSSCSDKIDTKYFSYIEIDNLLTTDLAELFLIKKFNPPLNRFGITKTNLLSLLEEFSFNQIFNSFYDIDIPIKKCRCRTVIIRHKLPLIYRIINMFNYKVSYERR